MDQRKVLQFTVVVLVILLVCHNSWAISTLGRNPFYPNYINDAAGIKRALIETKADVQIGLQEAGNPELYEPLFSQLADIELKKVAYGKGQTFEWMFYRKNGKGRVRVDKGVIWESDEPLESYEFFLDVEGTRYILTVPAICGNLALVGSGPAPAKVPAAVPPPKPAEPTGETATPGVGTVPQEVVTPAATQKIPVLVDGGYLNLLDPGHYAFARVGLEYPLNESFSIIGMIGGALQFDGEDGDDAFIADVFANYRFSRFFVALGLGAWVSAGDDDLDSEDTDLDVILNLGARLFGEPDGFNTSLFVEVRSAVDEMDDFDLYGRVGGGLRFSF